MKKPHLYFITGANGAGKSTLVPLLKKQLSTTFAVYDFDQRGVPEHVTMNWRLMTTKHWMQVAKRNHTKHLTSIVCGLSMPSEIHKIHRAVKGIPFKIALLDLSAPQIKKRLRKRFSSRVAVRNLKKVTGLTVSQCINANILNAKVLRKECKKYHCTRFNTSKTLPQRTTKKISTWIQK